MGESTEQDQAEANTDNAEIGNKDKKLQEYSLGFVKTQWKGKYQEEGFGNQGLEPWANLKVFEFWDLSRGILLGLNALTTLIQYYGGIDLLLNGNLFDFGYVTGSTDSNGSAESSDSAGADAGDGASPMALVLTLLATISRFGIFLDATAVFSQILAIRNGRKGIVYKIYARIYDKLHNGNPPLCLFETRSNLAQSALFSILTFECFTFVRYLLPAVLDLTEKDVFVYRLFTPIWALGYWVGFGSKSLCHVRTLWGMVVLAGMADPPPQVHNGITVYTMACGLRGPELLIHQDRVSQAEGWKGLDGLMAPIGQGKNKDLNNACVKNMMNSGIENSPVKKFLRKWFMTLYFLSGVYSIALLWNWASWRCWILIPVGMIIHMHIDVIYTILAKKAAKRQSELEPDTEVTQ